MAVGTERLGELTKGWLELESDPGLFTLLLEDFGVKGVQVEEVYDLQKPFEGPVYGFIFLFKWIEARRSRRKVTVNEECFVSNPEIVNNMFFAQQLIPNSCATHALLSVLLNCQRMKLGETLSQLKAYTHGMNPDIKGYAIGNMAELARAHNSHAKPERAHLPEKHNGVSTGRTMEAFHFVSYVPINNRLYELDGLKPYPIDHGPLAENEDWTEKFRRVITERLRIATGGEPNHDFRFSLMTVVPDKRQMLDHKLHVLKTVYKIDISNKPYHLVKVTHPDIKLPTKPLDAGQLENKMRDSQFQPVPAAALARSPTARARAQSDGGASTDDNQSTTSSGRHVIVKLPPELDTHNYAKSPILDASAAAGDDDDSDTEPPIPPGDSDREAEPQFHVSNTDHPGASSLEITKPLTVRTHFDRPPSPGESTDTASNASSAFNSPVRSRCPSTQASPRGGQHRAAGDAVAAGDDDERRAREIDKLVVIKMSNVASRLSEPQEGATAAGNSAEVGRPKEEMQAETPSGGERSEEAAEDGSGGKHHAFAPKDLLALLKNLESEIVTCESNLKEEQEKRKKYKIDDCRRTHDYDPFITTFLSMLAEQGILAKLVEQNTTVKRRQGVNVGRLNRKTYKRQRGKARRRK
ncbi:PREDICTED: ubiquitin carboxyl-terminal hydrolase calypso-like [Priapulus caudatus]|uniref:Ubiquitin carboxyl-terminal hydrolase n=1 Tax=Priapulus caudatus TaxID=37621 RepID=A0ABM1EFW8_PRICU|nr:PREDICTED: ubiquitin carboxyl-terminal hydrolase calypso-like [Priapulus caudatus]